MITSASNERIKAIRKLRDRKYRETSSKYFIEGTRIVYEAMQAHQTIDSMVFSEELIKNPVDRELIDQAERLGIELIEVSKDVTCQLALKKVRKRSVLFVIKTGKNWTRSQKAVCGSDCSR